MNALIKYAVRQVLAWMKEQVEATPNEADDQVYAMLRAWAIDKGLVDDGGQDDPGFRPTGGGDGGP